MAITSKNSTNIVRVEKKRNYTVINNTCLRDDRLSWKAKGIMAYLLQLPDDWVINLEEIITHSPDGEKSFRSGLDELKKYGYVVRFQIRDDKKRIVGWETIIYEVPQTVGNTLLAQKVDVGFVQVEKVDVENAGLLSTNITNNLKELSTNKPVHQDELEAQFEKFWTIYPKKMQKKDAKNKFKIALKKYDFPTIMKGTYKFNEYHRIKGTSIEYIPQPTTFFNQERYMDDYDALMTQHQQSSNTNKIFNPWEVNDGRESNQTNLFDNSRSIPSSVKTIGFGDVL